MSQAVPAFVAHVAPRRRFEEPEDHPIQGWNSLRNASRGATSPPSRSPHCVRKRTSCFGEKGDRLFGQRHLWHFVWRKRGSRACESGTASACRGAQRLAGSPAGASTGSRLPLSLTTSLPRPSGAVQQFTITLLERQFACQVHFGNGRCPLGFWRSLVCGVGLRKFLQSRSILEREFRRTVPTGVLTP